MSLSAQLSADLEQSARPLRLGRLDRVIGLHAEITGLRLAPGDVVTIEGETSVDAEVVSVSSDRCTALPLGSLHGLPAGAQVRSTGRTLQAPIGNDLIGRVLDGLGRPIDGAGPLGAVDWAPLHNEPPAAMSRPIVNTQLQTGVRAIDGLLSVGRGQRVGIMAGSGVGKSSLLSMLLRGTDADVTVLALVGERGREVKEFIDNDLGPEGLSRAVVVVATSDQPALVRRNAAFLAMRIAEGFRDAGGHALLLMDSLTRFAMAQREIGLAAGEVPSAKGYPPSVFGLLPQLLERAGTASTGSITGFFTVLVEGDDMQDPIGDTSRAILDGHVVLTRRLANAGHFPSIDLLQSASRCATKVTDEHQQESAAHFRRLLATHEEARDLIELGMYQAGSDPLIDESIGRNRAMTSFARQPFTELNSREKTFELLADIVGSPLPPNAVEQWPPTQEFPQGAQTPS